MELIRARSRGDGAVEKGGDVKCLIGRLNRL
jgi:hypothetical protein